MTLAALDRLFKKAISCRKCFEESICLSAAIDIAQPRFIGSDYWNSPKRILILLLNPGAGNLKTKRQSNIPFKRILYDYRANRVGLSELFKFEKEHMQSWGTPPGKYLAFYTEGLSIKLTETAFANIAWCADSRNQYPKKMLLRCFDNHTRELITLINPQIIILSGHSLHCFEHAIKAISSSAMIIKTLHYAHRGGKKKERTELNRVRQLINKKTANT